MAKKSGRKTLTETFALGRDPAIEPGPFKLWVIYRSYDSGDGAYPGDELVGDHLKVSPRTVQRWRAKLMKSGHLTQKLDGPKTARYRSVLPERDDNGGEATPVMETTEVASQETERDDGRGDAYGDDMTEASPSDTPTASPHSTLSTLSTPVPSLRSGTGDPQSGPPTHRTPVDRPTDDCTCGASKPASYRACFACLRAEAGFPAGASRGGGHGGSRCGTADHRPASALPDDAFRLDA